MTPLVTSPFRFGGLRIVESPLFVSRVRRPWRERLFTRPWRPLERERAVPRQGAVWLDDNTILVHPDTAVALRRAQADE